MSEVLASDWWRDLTAASDWSWPPGDSSQLSLTLAPSDNLSGLGPGGDGASKKLSLNAESLGLSLLSEEAFVSGDGGLVVT